MTIPRRQGETHAIDASATLRLRHRPLTSPPVEPSEGQAHLQRLVRRVADEDHNAFADLYDELSGGLLLDLEQTTEDPVHAAAISAATFVEVWALARFHATADTDVHVWVADIAARRTADRQSAAGIRQAHADPVHADPVPADPVPAVHARRPGARGPYARGRHDGDRTGVGGGRQRPP